MLRAPSCRSGRAALPPRRAPLRGRQPAGRLPPDTATCRGARSGEKGSAGRGGAHCPQPSSAARRGRGEPIGSRKGRAGLCRTQNGPSPALRGAEGPQPAPARSRRDPAAPSPHSARRGAEPPQPRPRCPPSPPGPARPRGRPKGRGGGRFTWPRGRRGRRGRRLPGGGARWRGEAGGRRSGGGHVGAAAGGTWGRGPPPTHNAAAAAGGRGRGKKITAKSYWQRWDSNPRPRRDWSLNPAP